jgi:hypothetical protein
MSAELRTEEEGKRVVAAIIAGVTACLQEEEFARAALAARRRPAPAVNLWPVMGREEMMRMRAMWQRRMA